MKMLPTKKCGSKKRALVNVEETGHKDETKTFDEIFVIILYSSEPGHIHEKNTIFVHICIHCLLHPSKEIFSQSWKIFLRTKN